MKAKTFFLYLIVSIILSSCSFKETNKVQKDTSTSNIYINNGGNLEILEITNINNKKIIIEETTSINFKKQGDILHSVENISGGTALASFYDTTDGSLNNKVLTIKGGKILNKITLKHEGPSLIISDPERNRAYVLSALIPGLYKDGIPLDAISTLNYKQTDPINVKGAVLNYGIHKENLYFTVVKANDMGYQGVPNNYILEVNLLDGKQKILTPDGFNYSPKGMFISDEGIIYIIEMPLDPQEFKKSSILGYNSSGKLISEFPLSSGVRDVVIDEQGLAYITNNDKEVYGDRKGTTITIIDTKNGKTLGYIDGLYSPTEIKKHGELLFVVNDLNNTVSIINSKNKSIIKNISFGKDTSLSSLMIMPREE
ncbi:hypothetical protein C2I18_25100 [Paenibacillus sp. PK3_47]|uniref:YncE family protein n=1 Tax=Paenibacillus sp. PK3_47 TaxID=2072642 RepID=UPI00201DFCDF|nr:hypothetical protein [Paenibacillus sp. PK3_47]UQZ36522.1 hypothetical protein C2I18_25100 [Paenibacillus sp. PK3_47]